MPPQKLIRIKEQDLEVLLESSENAEVFCNQVLELSPPIDRKIDDNLVVSKTIYGNVRPGDWVIASGNSDYSYLLGTVTAIDKLGTTEHETGNPTDDIHVDFFAFDYPEERISEIEQTFSDLFGEDRTIDNFSLDDVIMAPDELISLNHLSYEEISRMGNLRENCEAFCNCFQTEIISENKKRAELMERIKQNYDEYHKSLMSFGKQELIDMAAKIAAMSETYEEMCCYDYSEEELNFFLQFQNPLEIVADGWSEYNASDLDSIGFVFDGLRSDTRQQDALNNYPLMNMVGADNTLRRFMGVDLIDFLIKISDKARTHYPKDWMLEVNPLYEASLSDNPEVKRLMWQVTSDGTHMFTERETFISGTSAFNSWTNYSRDKLDIFGYAVEVTGRSGQRIIGNVFEVGNYAEHAENVKESAVFEDLATLTYSPAFGINAGKTITVPHSEYLYNPDLLSGKKGKVVHVLLESVKSLGSVADLMQSEHLKRMTYPIGSMEAHLKQLTQKLAEIREPSENGTDIKTNKSLGEKLSAANKKVKRENKLTETGSHKHEER